MKTLTLLTSLSLLALVGCTDNQEQRGDTATSPPASETASQPESTLPPPSEQTAQPADPMMTPPSSSQAMQPEETSPGMEAGMAAAGDEELEKQVEDALNADTTLAAQAENIQIEVEDGTVTLQGSVPSEEEKQQIARKVQQVEGVKQVDNQLQVTS